MILIKLLSLAALMLVISCGEANQKRVLVLLDHLGTRETHSNYFKALKDDGFQVTFKTADDSSLALSRYGDYLYEHVILFSPSVAEFGGNVSVKAIVDFIDDGGNLLVAANADVAEPVREIAAECGFEYSEEKSFVVDRFATDASDDGLNTLLVIDRENLISNRLIAGEASAAPLLFKGVGMSADAENPLIINILTGGSTSFTYVPDAKITEYPHSVGKSTLLIAAMQARNNARVTFSGSLDFFSNEFFEAQVQKATSDKRAKSGNEEVALAVTRWTFKERGVLRVAKVEHHLVGEKNAPAAYTIKDDTVFAITIEEYANGKWAPFKGNDVQLEFVRLDPFVRTTLANKNGKLETRFILPDVYGIFKFMVDYNRVGYTHLVSTTQVSVRPMQHTEYERFIPAAFPYYVSAFSMIVGVYLFSFVMLYHSDQQQNTKKTE